MTAARADHGDDLRARLSIGRQRSPSRAVVTIMSVHPIDRNKNPISSRKTEIAGPEPTVHQGSAVEVVCRGIPAETVGSWTHTSPVLDPAAAPPVVVPGSPVTSPYGMPVRGRVAPDAAGFLGQARVVRSPPTHSSAVHDRSTGPKRPIPCRNLAASAGPAPTLSMNRLLQSTSAPPG